MASGNGNGSAEDVLKKSVTAGDYNPTPFSGIYHLNFPGVGSANVDLPPFWSFARDYALASLFYRESMWASAVALAVSKIVAQGYQVDSDIPLRAKRAQDLFVNFDSRRGYVPGLQKHLLNFLMTGNGGHVEIVRATSALGSRILGLVPLDTFRCRRTGDPQFPIIYRDRAGREHVMREFDVFSIADLPDPADTWFGLGHCAAERAYGEIIKLEAISRYVREKVTGQRVLAIHVIGGVTPQNLEDAKKTAQADAQARGVVTYLGAAMLACMGDQPVSLQTIPLAELPDGFDRKQEWDIALNTYARAIGIPVQDLQPLSGQGLGTGAQTEVLNEAAKGQGLAAWRQTWEYCVNEWALDERTTYSIHVNDIRDKEREAKVRIDEGAAILNWYNMGLTPEQAINLGVDRDQLPEEYRPQDLTPGTQLDEGEKPELETADAAQAPREAPDTQRPAAPAKPATGAPGAIPNIKSVSGGPSQAQIAAGNYAKDHIKWAGLDVSVENRAGSTRRGVGPDGKEWARPMHFDYGYIRRTEGVDGDHVDVYLGPDEQAPYAYVVHQLKPATGAYDEDKCMLGFDSEAAAKAAYLKQYDNAKFFGAITAVPMSMFKEKVLSAKGEPVVPDGAARATGVAAKQASDTTRLAESLDNTAAALREYAAAQAQAQTRYELESARAEKALQAPADLGPEVVALLGQMVTLLNEPAPAPVVNVAAPVVNVRPPAVHVAAPPPAVVNVPAPVVTIKAAAPTPAPAADYEVTARDAQGRVSRWKETPRHG